MMNPNTQLIQTEIEKGITLTKCQQCGCMRETLDNLSLLLPAIATDNARELLQHVSRWNAQTVPVKYSCLGCAYCYPAVAQNAFAEAFPGIDQLTGLSCDFRSTEGWPAIVGEYFVVDAAAHVAVTTLASVDLAKELADAKPRGLAIVGKTETENIGIDKIIKNVIANRSLQYLVITGKESAGHASGQTLIALARHGVDANKRIIGSTAKRPILQNVSVGEIAMFRDQIEIIDLIGCENTADLCARIESLSPKTLKPCG
jgi:tetrahydromethanopterin S-methyltransferase subunit A